MVAANTAAVDRALAAAKARLAAVAVELAAVCGCLRMDAEDTTDPATAVKLEATAAELQRTANRVWQYLDGGGW